MLGTDVPSPEALTRKYFNRVYGFCRLLLRDEADVEDACQEVFLTVSLRRRELSQLRDPWAWLMKITRLTCLYLRRKRSRLEPADPEEAVDPAGDDSPAAGSPLRREEMGRVWAAMKRLPPRYREVLALHYQQDLAQEEISEVMDLSRGAVRVLLHRATVRLRQEVRWP